MKAVKENVRKYYKYVNIPFTQPTLTENGTLGIDDFAVFCSLPQLQSGRELYKAFDNDLSTNFQSVSKTTNPQYITVFSKKQLHITKITFYQLIREQYYYIKNLIIQASNDNTNWVDLANWSTNSYTEQFTVELTNNDDFYNYYRFYITNRAYYASDNAYIIFREIEMNGGEKVLQESTEQDYDLYKDITIYKAVKENVSRDYEYEDTPGNNPGGHVGGIPTIDDPTIDDFDEDTVIYKTIK